MSRNKQPRQPKRKGGGVTALLVIILLLLIGLSVFMIYLCTTVANDGTDGRPGSSESLQPQQPQVLETQPTETEPPETTMPEPEHVVSTATVTTTGDLLMHTPLYQAQYNSICYNGETMTFPLFLNL